jgi:hypothetical protein
VQQKIYAYQPNNQFLPSLTKHNLSYKWSPNTLNQIQSPARRCEGLSVNKKPGGLF